LTHFVQYHTSAQQINWLLTFSLQKLGQHYMHEGCGIASPRFPLDHTVNLRTLHVPSVCFLH